MSNSLFRDAGTFDVGLGEPLGVRRRCPRFAGLQIEHNHHGCRRFTLIELLTVMVILTVLAALLLPTVLDARAKGQQTYCANNLRQIGIAMVTYSDEYDEFVMPGKFGVTADSGDYNHWINYMYAELLPTRSVFLCPSLGRADHFNPAGGSNEIVAASYIRNLIQPGTWNGAPIYTDPGASWGWGSAAFYVKQSQVLRPSAVIDVMDVIAGGIHSNHSGIVSFGETDWGIVNDKPLSGYRRVGLHHRRGFNALMGDGHVEHMRESDPNQWVVVVE